MRLTRELCTLQKNKQEKLIKMKKGVLSGEINIFS